MTRLSLALLGPYHATLGGRPLPSLTTVKVQALLTYLVTERVLAPGVAPRRETLMALLWPGMPEPSSRQSLRQALYLLRQAIPAVEGPDGDVPLVLSDHRALQINPQARYELDLAAFAELTAAGEPQALAEAVRLYRGDFLSDFYLDDSNEFEAWAAARRAALREQALDAMEALAGHYLAQGDYEQAEAAARRQVELEPLREEGQRQLIEALARAGRRSAALAAYEAFRELLQRELGVAPGEQTQQLMLQIRAGRVQATPHGSGRARQYELQEAIGQGSFGVVYRALQPVVGREVAVKAIRRRYADDPAFIRRFEAEAQLVARLEHPHIVPLYDFWREPGGAYLVMRWMRGGSLKEALAAGPWPLERTARLLDEVAAALETAHQQGVVHLDIKPANILLDEAGRAYLTDFGIAKQGPPGRRAGDTAASGSPHYLAPEQLAGQELSPLTDLYSLALVLYELLAGQRPYGDTPTGLVLVKRLSEPLPPLHALRPELPAAVEAVIHQATARQPAERYPDAAALAAAFRQAAQGQAVAIPAVSRPRREVPNPYLGLRPFDEADAGRFFGREALAAQLVEALRAGRFLVVVGPSGSSKSSVVRAGLLPALRRGALPGSDEWFITEMIPGEHPFEELEAALLRVAVSPPPTLLAQLQEDARGLVRAAKRLLPGRDGALLLVVDQFEELYTLVADEGARRRFLDLLQAAVADTRGRLRVVLTLRADFYDRPLSTQAFGELVRDHTVAVVPPTKEELARAIRLPAEQVGVEVDEALLTALVNDVYDRPGALPLLQYALTELFERRQEQRMSLGDYELIGGVRGALANRAEALYQELDAPQQALARQLFLRLVTVGEGAEDTRRRVLRAELDSLLAGDNPENGNGAAGAHVLAAILERFGRHRLLTFDRDPATRAPTVEVAHEALLTAWPRFREWIQTGRDDLRQQRKLTEWAQEWDKAGREPGLLLRGARLDQMAGWAAQTDLALSGGEAALLEASLAARQERAAAEEARRQRELETAQRLAEEERARAEEQARAAQRLRRRALSLAGALGLAVVLALLALNFGRAASANAATAATRQAEAEAEAALRATAQAQAESERANAERERNIAFSRELAGAALTNLDSDPELSLMLALQALKIAHTQEAENRLHQALAASRVERTLFGHTSGVSVLTFSPDGTLLASGSWDNTVHVWDVESGEMLQTLMGIDARVIGLAFDPAGERLSASSFDGAIGIWDVHTGEQIMALTLTEDMGWVEEIAFSPNGRLLATSGQNQTTLWDLATGRPQLSFPEGRENVAFSPDGRLLVFSSGETDPRIQDWNNVSVWDLSADKELAKLSGHTDPIVGLSFSPDGRLLATEGFDAVRIWDMDLHSPETFGQQVAVLDEPQFGSSASTINFLPDNRRVLFLGQDDQIKVWDIEGSVELFSFPCAPTPNAVVINPAGTLVASPNVDGAIKLCGLDPTHEWQTIAYDDGNRFYDVAFNREGTLLYTAYRGGKLSVWDATEPGFLSKGQELVLIEDPDNRYYDVELSSDGDKLAAAAFDGLAYLWESETGKELSTFGPHDNVVWKVAISPDGAWLATASYDHTARVWDLSSGEAIYTLTGFGDLVTDVAFSPDGRLLVTSSWDERATGWDTATGAEQFRLIGTYDLVKFSPDGRFLATAGNDPVVRLWDLSEYGDDGLPREIRRMTGHREGVAGLTFSPDGTRLASASSDHTARVWDVSSGEEIVTLQAHSDSVFGVAFSPDGKRLATASWDGTVRVFLLELEEVVALARSRLTRWFTDDECRVYLHADTCPAAP